MKPELQASARPRVRRMVVKIGSSSLAKRPSVFAELAAAAMQLRSEGVELVVVSSGAVALGMQALDLAARPTEMATLQACAAVGQSLLMRAWQQAFGESKRVAQVLLTHSDLSDRARYLTVQRALQAMLELGATPIINENDTVAVDEMKFGDNDQLAAMVSTLVAADLLVLLTDVAGLLNAAGERIARVDDIDAAIARVDPVSGSGLGTGGMGSKLKAAHLASLRGVPVVIADARNPASLELAARGSDVGTWFGPPLAEAHGTTSTGLSSRKHWIAYTLRPKGAVVVDRGAAHALAKASLLCTGVLGVRGAFVAGDAVSVVDGDGREVARGLARLDAGDVAKIAGRKGHELEGILGFEAGPEVIHRDDLVVL